MKRVKTMAVTAAIALLMFTATSEANTADEKELKK